MAAPGTLSLHSAAGQTLHTASRLTGRKRLPGVVSSAHNMPCLLPVHFTRPAVVRVRTAALFSGRRKPAGCHPVRCAVQEEETSKPVTTEETTIEATEQAATDSPSSNETDAAQRLLQLADSAALVIPELKYEIPTDMDMFWTRCKLIFALPWRRFKKDSVLVIKLGGEIPEKVQGRFSPTASLPAICEALRKAAVDPRVNGIYLKISPLAVGWGKLQEIRRHIDYFRSSGKYTIAYMERGGEKEYFLASACAQLYIPPTAALSLRGFTLTGTFLRGVLSKVGVEPQVKRIGAYKSAGDQLLRTDMSEEQREQLDALLQDVYSTFVDTIAEARAKEPEEVRSLLDRGVYEMNVFKDEGWVTDLKYEDEILEDLKPKTGGKDDEVAAVPLSRYSKVNPSAFGLTGKKVIAVIRASGAIIGGSGSPAATTITQDEIIRQLRLAKKNKSIVAVVLRVDSPGGDALASDIMWREIKQLAAKKPVIASMSDVAASGGYYMSMAANKIVAEPLTITGSIGVVTGKFNLQELYGRIGYNKVLLSEGKYAEILADNRSFTEEEQKLFDEAAEHAYQSFRNKAAESRGMSIDDMQGVAQGRVWSGMRSINNRLVDALGGLNRAILLAKDAAGIDMKEPVRLLELSRGRTSPLQLLGGGATASAAPLMQLLQMIAPSVTWGGGVASTAGLAALPFSQLLQQTVTEWQYADGQPKYLMPELEVDGAGGKGHLSSSQVTNDDLIL